MQTHIYKNICVKYLKLHSLLVLLYLLMIIIKTADSAY